MADDAPGQHERAAAAAPQDALAEALAQACARLAPVRVQASLSLTEALDTFADPRNFWLPASTAIRGEDAAIAKLIRDDARFPSTSMNMRSYTHEGMFFPEQCAPLLLEWSLRTSPEEAIQRLLAILATPSAKGVLASALWGLSVADEIELMEGVSLLPLSSLPQSPQRDQVMRDPVLVERSSAIDMLMLQAPACALVAKRVVDPLFVDPAKRERDFSGYIADQELLAEIAIILSAVGPSCPVQSVGWWQFDDPDIQAAEMTRSRHGQMLEILPKPGDPVSVVDPAVARAVVSGFFKLDADTRQKIKLAALRLNRAMRRHDVGDRAVELAIALESLTGDGENNELTHKVRTRCARFLGGSTDERMATATIVSATYGIRSTMVHTGKANLAKKTKVGAAELDGAEVVARAAGICAKVIQAIIARGSMPNWRELDID